MSSTPNTSKTYFLISHDKSIYIENDQVFENDQKISPIEGSNEGDKTQPKQTAEGCAHSKTREYYSSFLKNRFENLSVLTGAGSSIGSGGKTRDDLWDTIVKKITESVFQEFCEIIKCDWSIYSSSKDIESLLTNAYRARQFLIVDGMNAPQNINIEAIISDIESVIRECCQLKLPQDAPHVGFIKKITSRNLSDPRAKIFTLNYDTLFEQAAKEARCWVVDGFSFEELRRFQGSNFDYDFVIREGSRVKDEDNYVPNVIHIYKPHGSMDWEKQGEQVVKNPTTKAPVIIYPKESKYENSFEQPFFEMMLRFQQEVRKKNALLIIIGFSFYDKHIKNIILEALDVNPGLRCVVVTKNLEVGHILELHKRARDSHNLILVDEMFSDFVVNYPFPFTYSNDKSEEIGGHGE